MGLMIVFVALLSIGLAYSITDKILNTGLIEGTFGELLYAFSTNIYFLFGLPITIIMFLVMYVYMENVNSGWKLLDISGGDIRRMIISKLIISYLILLVSYITFLILFLCTGKIGGFSINLKSMIEQLGYSFLGAILNTTFLFVIFHSFRLVVINSLVGIVGMVINSVLIQTKYWRYFFTTYYYNVNQAEGSERLLIILISLIGGIFLFALSIKISKKFGKNFKND